MPGGQHRPATHHRRARLRWLGGAAIAGLATAVLLAVTPADAATHDVKAQLALSGVATQGSPAGGSQVGVHPGDAVTFSAAGVPTVGLDKLGLGSLVSQVDNLLSGAAKFQVRANFSQLPGGSANTVLSGSKAVTFHFPNKGTYNFTWTVEKVTVVTGLLGDKHTQTSTINLNGNELRKAGVKLNAYNQYVGQVVVKRKPPAGGISVQLPSVHVAPSVTGVGQLPTVGVPGVKAPTLPVSVPALPSLPGQKSSKPPAHHGGGHKKSGGSGKLHHYTTVPELVVPKGNNSAVLPGGGYTGALPAAGPVANNLPPVPATNFGPHANHAQQAKPSPASTPAHKTIDLATDAKDPSGQLPVILAIISIIALALVAGTYARLFLLKRNL